MSGGRAAAYARLVLAREAVDITAAWCTEYALRDPLGHDYGVACSLRAEAHRTVHAMTSEFWRLYAAGSRPYLKFVVPAGQSESA